MFAEHEASALALGVETTGDTEESAPASPEQVLYYLPPISQTQALRKKKIAMLKKVNEADIKSYKAQVSVFCSCEGENDPIHNPSKNKKSMVCLACGKIILGGVLLGKQKEVDIATERLTLADTGT